MLGLSLVRSYLEDGSAGELGWWRATREWCGEPKTHVHTSTVQSYDILYSLSLDILYTPAPAKRARSSLLMFSAREFLETAGERKNA
jgi:hypothetical protein